MKISRFYLLSVLILFSSFIYVLYAFGAGGRDKHNYQTSQITEATSPQLSTTSDTQVDNEISDPRRALGDIVTALDTDVQAVSEADLAGDGLADLSASIQ